MTLASRIGVMQAGRIVQTGTPREVYERPASRFVADFVGTANLIATEIVAVDGDTLTLARTGDGTRLRHSDAGGGRCGERAWLMLRPEALHILDPALPDRRTNTLPATIGASVFLGDAWRIEATLADGQSVIVTVPNANRATAPAWPPGRAVRLGWDVASGVLLRA